MKTTIGLRHWIADLNSIALYGRGAPIDWSLFTDAKYGTAGKRRVPSGAAVKLVNGKIGPADGTGTSYLMFSEANEDSKTDSISGYGLVTGGNVYEDFLFDAAGAPRVLAAGLKTSLGSRFHFQTIPGVN